MASIYTKDVYYFDIIDTEQKAYWLGMMYADGNNNGEGFSLGLKSSDKMHVEAFAKTIFIGRHPKLGYIKPNTHMWNGLTIKGSGSYRIQVSSQYMSKSLSLLGCVPCKSTSVSFPTSDQVPSHFISHFVRGYFDGDGCIGIYNQDGYLRAKLSMICSISFGECLAKIMRENGYRVLTRLQGKMMTLTLNGNEEIDRFCQWMYKDSTVWLERKYVIWASLKENNKKTVPYKRHSRHINITYDSHAKRWLAHVRENGKIKYVGRGKTEEEAYNKQQIYINQLRKALEMDALHRLQ